MPVAPASMLRGTLNAHSKLFKGSYRSFSMPLSDSDSISSIETSDQALNFPESSVRIGRFSVCVLYLKSMLGTGILGLGDVFGYFDDRMLLF